MAEKKPVERSQEVVVLYVTAAEREEAKAAVAAAGGRMEGSGKTMRFVPAHRQWMLYADTVSPEVFARVLEATARWRTDEARAHWERELARVDAVRAREDKAGLESGGKRWVELFAPVSEQKEMLEAVEKTGVKMNGGRPVVWDRRVGRWVVPLDEMPEADVARVLDATKAWRTPEARRRWEEAARREPREPWSSGQEDIREFVRRQAWRAFERDRNENVNRRELVVFIPAADRARVQQLLAETRSLSIDGPIPGSRRIRTDHPERFAEWANARAREQLIRETEGRMGAAGNNLEASRAAALVTPAARFLETYGNRGFLLANPEPADASEQQAEAARRRYESQIQFMRIQPTDVIRQVLAVTKARVDVLRDKENRIRSERSGLSVNELISMPRDQRPPAAREQVLSNEEMRELFALQRGLKALYREMDNRRMGWEGRTRETEVELVNEASELASRAKSSVAGKAVVGEAAVGKADVVARVPAAPGLQEAAEIAAEPVESRPLAVFEHVAEALRRLRGASR